MCVDTLIDSSSSQVFPRGEKRKKKMFVFFLKSIKFIHLNKLKADDRERESECYRLKYFVLFYSSLKIRK